MTAPLSLTPAEADAKIAQIDEAMINVKTLANRILDTTTTMTATSWLGGQAKMFGAGMMQNDEDFRAIVASMEFLAEKGKSDIATIAGADADGM